MYRRTKKKKLQSVSVIIESLYRRFWLRPKEANHDRWTHWTIQWFSTFENILTNDEWPRRLFGVHFGRGACNIVVKLNSVLCWAPPRPIKEPTHTVKIKRTEKRREKRKKWRRNKCEFSNCLTHIRSHYRLLVTLRSSFFNGLNCCCCCYRPNTLITYTTRPNGEEAR